MIVILLMQKINAGKFIILFNIYTLTLLHLFNNSLVLQ